MQPASMPSSVSFDSSLSAMKTSSIFLGLLLLILVSVPAAARTIDWGNSVGDALYDSAGAALDSSFVFELGSFGSFVPTALNLEDWESNWKAFDRASTPSDWNAVAGFFSSSATMEDGGVSSEAPPLSPHVFAAGEQAYIWVFNTQTMAYGFTEWALLTDLDDWMFPAPGGKTDEPLEWRISTADTLVYGGLADQQGPGDYTVDPPSFAIQTHAVVPEPTTGVLVLLAAGVAMWRRRR